MGVLKNITDEYFKKSLRSEDGVYANIGGKRYFIRFEDYGFANELVPINDEGDLFIPVDDEFLVGDESKAHMCMELGRDRFGNISNIYYTLPESALNNAENGILGGGKITRRFVSHSSGKNDTPYDLVGEDFLPLRILYEADLDEVDFRDELSISEFDDRFRVEDGNKCFEIFNSWDNAHKAAIESEIEILNDCYGDAIEEDQVEKWRGYFGDDWIYDNSIEEWFDEDRKSYFEEIKSESGEHGNRLYDELIDSGVIDDTEEYFKLDTDSPTFEPKDYIEDLVHAIADRTGADEEYLMEGVKKYSEQKLIKRLIDYDVIQENSEYFKLDYTEPKFNDDDKIQEVIENVKSDDDFDCISEFIFNFGELDKSYCDIDRLAEHIVDEDGNGNTLGSYDGEEYTCEIDDTTYYIYIST